MAFAIKWTELENIMLREIYQAKEHMLMLTDNEGEGRKEVLSIRQRRVKEEEVNRSRKDTRMPKTLP